MKKIVATENAPKAIGPYSQATMAGDLVITSGQLPINPATGAIVEGGIEEQTAQALTNVKAVLEAAGTGMDNVLKTTCYMADMNDFQAMNKIYGTFFKEGMYPSRSAFQVAKLPMGALVEIEAIATK